MEGLDLLLEDKLKKAGVVSVESLLRAGGTRAARLSISVRSGIDGKKIQRFVEEADLMRVHGVGPTFAFLLREAGVHSVQELAAREAMNLVDAMFEVNLVRELLAVLPSERQVAAWIWRAKTLPPLLSHQNGGSMHSQIQSSCAT
jgi:hypothetical protein